MTDGPAPPSPAGRWDSSFSADRRDNAGERGPRGRRRAPGALRDNAGGIAVTLCIHALVLSFFVAAQRDASARRAPIGRDVIRTRLVRLGKARPRHLLPRKPTAPRPAARKEPVMPRPPDAKPAPPEPPEDPAAGDRAADDVFAGVRNLPEGPSEEAEGSPDGVAGATDSEASGDPYATAIHALILQSWQVPELVKDADLYTLRAGVFLRADASGTILEHSVTESSGNRFFDASVVEAVARIEKLPPPPPDWAARLSEGVILEFTPTQ